MKKPAAALVAWLRRLWRGMQHPFFLLAAAACAGIYTADLLAWKSWWPCLAAGGIAALAAWRWRSTAARLLACAAAFAAFHIIYDADPLRDKLADAAAPGGAVPATLSGLITDAPEAEFMPGKYSFPLRIEHLECLTLTGDFAGRTVNVHLSEVTKPPAYGDRIELRGLLRRPQSPRNPGEFDLPSYLRRQSISAEFEASTPWGNLTVKEHDAGNPVVAAALRSRDWIGATVTAGIEHDPDMAATVRAMVLGTREKTPSEVRDAFVASGTMHVFAVSGLHVALFCIIVFWLLRRTPLPYAWILAITLPLVFYYVFITGLRPSAWRAAMMSAVVLCAPLFDRESRMLNSLGAAALLLLACNTQQLFQPGFTLSFGVILTIAATYPFFREKVFRRLGEPDPFLPPQLLKWRQRRALGAGGFVRDSVCLSLASSVGSLPLMIHYFSLITPVGIVANIFLVALSNAILATACASLICSGLGLGFLSVLCNKLNWLLAVLSVKCAQFFASIPGGHANVHPSRLFRGDVCEVTVLELDTGGAALHIDTPGGRHWLVDTGGLRHFFRSVRPHLTRTPVNQLDGLLLSHPDSYHTGGAPHVRSVFHPREEPKLHASQEITLEPGTTLRCLFPPDHWNAPTADDRCAVFMLTHRDTRILIMNDAGFITEKSLLAANTAADLHADILIKGRHASDFSGLPEFINAVHPRAVIFTNDVFPESESVPPEWIKMVESKSARLFDQKQTGAVIIRIENDATTITGFSDHSAFTLEH